MVNFMFEANFEEGKNSVKCTLETQHNDWGYKQSTEGPTLISGAVKGNVISTFLIPNTSLGTNIYFINKVVRGSVRIGFVVINR